MLPWQQITEWIKCMHSLLIFIPALHYACTVVSFSLLYHQLIPPLLGCIRLFHISLSIKRTRDFGALHCCRLLPSQSCGAAHYFPFSQLCPSDFSSCGGSLHLCLCPQNSPQYPVKTLGKQVFSDVVNWCYSGALGISISCRSDDELDLVMMDPDGTPSNPCPLSIHWGWFHPMISAPRYEYQFGTQIQREGH